MIFNRFRITTLFKIAKVDSELVWLYFWDAWLHQIGYKLLTLTVGFQKNLLVGYLGAWGVEGCLMLMLAWNVAIVARRSTRCFVTSFLFSRCWNSRAPILAMFLDRFYLDCSYSSLDLVTYVLWSIWKVRNNFVFWQQIPNPATSTRDSSDKLNLESEYWWVVHRRNKRRSYSRSDSWLVRDNR